MSEQFGEKGVIINTAVSERVRAVLALYPDKKADGYIPLLKPTVRRKDRRKDSWKHTQPFKAWLSVGEVYALIHVLERAVVLMEEYYDGTLDLKSILAEDEEVRGFIRTESTMKPTIEKMFEPFQEDEDDT